MKFDITPEEAARLPIADFLEWNRQWTDRFCDEEAMRWYNLCGNDKAALDHFQAWQTFARFAFQNPTAEEFVKKEGEHFQAMLALLIAIRIPNASRIF